MAKRLRKLSTKKDLEGQAAIATDYWETYLEHGASDDAINAIACLDVLVKKANEARMRWMQKLSKDFLLD